MARIHTGHTDMLARILDQVLPGLAIPRGYEVLSYEVAPWTADSVQVIVVIIRVDHESPQIYNNRSRATTKKIIRTLNLSQAGLPVYSVMNKVSHRPVIGE
jgi:hypothetical protein